MSKQQLLSENELLQYRIKMIKESKRTLDGPPRKFKVTPIENTRIYNIASIFSTVYSAEYEKVDKSQPCKIMLTSAEAIVDIVPFTCLKTLLLLNISRDQSLSKVCILLFQRILENSTKQSDNNIIHITTDSFKNTLMNLRVTTVYANSLIKGMFACAYPDEYIDKVWNDILNVDTTRYENLRAAGIRYLKLHPEYDTEESVLIALRSAYKEAAKVKGFCNKFSKDLSNEAKGMAYLTFMEDPSVFTEFDKNSAMKGVTVIGD